MKYLSLDYSGVRIFLQIFNRRRCLIKMFISERSLTAEVRWFVCILIIMVWILFIWMYILDC